MNISVIELIKLGQKYLSLWPNKPELAHYFSDYNTVQLARLVCRYFPALAFFIFTMQLYIASGYPFGQGSILSLIDSLPTAFIYLLFFLSIPVQALVIAGVKADKLLPPSLESWYKSGLEKAKEADKTKKDNDRLIAIRNLATYKPRYIDLAQLLQLSFQAGH